MTFAKAYAQENPEEIAIRDPSSQLTWSEVDDVLNRCANGLQSMDLGPDVRIAVFAEGRSVAPDKWQSCARHDGAPSCGTRVGQCPRPAR